MSEEFWKLIAQIERGQARAWEEAAGRYRHVAVIWQKAFGILLIAFLLSFLLNILNVIGVF